MKLPLKGFVRRSMLSELRRSHYAARLRIRGRHWSDWAQRLIERYARLKWLRAASITLVLPRVSRLIIRERSKVLSPLYRQIYLITYPILRETIRREQGKLVLATKLRSNPISKPFNVDQSTENPVQSLVCRSSQYFERVPMVKPLPAQFQVIKVLAPKPSSVQFAKLAKRLERVLQERVPGERIIRVHRRNETVQEHDNATTRRVVSRMERVEERVAGTIALITRRPITYKARQAEASTAESESKMANTHAARKIGAGLSIQSPSPLAPVNVESLADQVIQLLERRVSAWRERMGRV
jgi:hypothetical protein